MSTWIPLLFLLLSLMFFTHRRLLRYLQFFQQEEYKGKRFLAWLWQAKAFDSRGSLVCAASLASAFLLPTRAPSLPYFLGGALFAVVAGFENDPRRAGQASPQYDRRVCRIYRVGFFILCVGLFAILLLEHCVVGSQNLLGIMGILGAFAPI